MKLQRCPGLTVSGLSVLNERVSCRNIQWEWWIQSAGKQQAVCSRQLAAVTWEGTLWCLSRAIILGTSNPLRSHTIKGKCQLRQISTEPMGETDWRVLIAWSLSKGAYNRWISSPSNASWNQWKYPLSLTHRSKKIYKQYTFSHEFHALHMLRLGENAINRVPWRHTIICWHPLQGKENIELWADLLSPL